MSSYQHSKRVLIKQSHLGQLRGELWRKSTRQWWTIQLSGKPYHEHHINDKQNQFKSISDDYDSDWGLNLTYIQNLIWLPEEELAFFFVLVPPEPIEIRGWLNAWIKIDLLTHITSAMSNVSTNQSVSYLVLTFKEYVKKIKLFFYLYLYCWRCHPYKSPGSRSVRMSWKWQHL